MPSHRFGRQILTRVLLLGLLAAPLLAPTISAQNSVPARLTDAEFWKLSNDLSDVGGTFRSENYLSNETGYQLVIPELQRILKTGGVYLGVGPEQNFTYIAALQPKIVFIIDIRRGNLHEHLMYKALFELARDRADFLSMLFSRPRPAGLDSTSTDDQLFTALYAVRPDTGLHRRTLSQIENLLTRQHGFTLQPGDMPNISTILGAFYDYGPGIDYSSGGGGMGGGGRGQMPTYWDLMVATDGTGAHRSYLANEASWRTIKDLETRNLIVPVVGDFGAPKALRSVGAWVKEHGATVSAYYLSNVEQYLFQDGKQATFYGNVETLPIEPSSVFIRSGGGGGRGGGGMSSQHISTIASILTAFREGRLYDFNSVLAMSH